MGWVRVANSAGKFAIDVYYTVNSQSNSDCSSNVSVSKIRFIQTNSYYYFWNNYPTSSSLCATLGIGINDSLRSQKVVMGEVKGTREYNISAVNVKIKHDKNTGRGGFYIKGYSNTQTPYGNMGWTSKWVDLPQLDRQIAFVSVVHTGTYDTYLSFRASTTKALSGVYYRINGGGWIKPIGAVGGGGTVNFNVGGLSPNTTYKIGVVGTTASNNIDSSETVYNIRTDAGPPSIPSISINSVDTTSFTFTVSSSPSSNNPVTAYAYALDGGPISGWSSSNVFRVGGLSPNLSYDILAKALSSNGKESPYQGATVRTTSNPPTLGSVYVNEVHSDSIVVSVFNISSEVGISKVKYHINGTLVAELNNTGERYTYRNLKENTTYLLTVIIVDNVGKISAKSVQVTTKIALPKSFDIKISELSGKYFVVSVPSFGANITAIRYYLNGAYYSESGYVKKFNALTPFTNYAVKVVVYDDDGKSVTSNIQNVRTWPLPPVLIPLLIDKISPTEIVFTPQIQKSPGTSVKDYYYSIDKTTPSIRITELPFTIRNLKPNTIYELRIKAIDAYNQSSIQDYSFRTIEDKWVMVSVNGSPFKKVNLNLIFQNGEKKKIEKSKRKIIK